jgi:hypothetical protein
MGNKRKPMKIKYAIILILAVIVVGAGVGLKMYFKPHADISKMEAQYKITANKLIDKFQSYEEGATKEYSEKVLEISGKLVAKNKLPNGTNLLVLEDEMQGISCQLDSAWSSANQPVIEALTTGGQVTVKGVCKGYLMEIKVSPAVVVK